MKKLITLSVLLSLLIISCDKLPKDPDPDPTPTPAPNPSPTFVGADGVMVAVSTLTYQSSPIGDVAMDFDVATAVFFNTDNTYYSVGALDVNSHSLELSDNNAYVSMSTTSTNIDLGFSSSNNNTWTIGGNSAMPAFTHTTSRGMPSDIKFTSEYETIKVADAHTISIVSAPSTCDSILYVLVSGSKTVIKTVSSTTTSVTFSAAEMSGLSGSGVAQVAAYNYEHSIESGKNMYYVNEKVISDFVKFE